MQPYYDHAGITRGTSQGPTAALFEADGGAWRDDAIANVAAYLQRHLDEWTVIA